MFYGGGGKRSVCLIFCRSFIAFPPSEEGFKMYIIIVHYNYYYNYLYYRRQTLTCAMREHYNRYGREEKLLNEK